MRPLLALVAWADNRCMRDLRRLVWFATVLLVAGCGGSISVNNRGQVAVGANTLDVASLPFTFRYPVSFQEATDASVRATQSVAVVGIPGEDSYIAVHLNGNTPMSLGALEAQARQALGSNVISVARENHVGMPMVAVTTRVAGRPDLLATMHGFSAAGRTWLLECRSNAANRESMKQWCAQALDSLKLRS
jgi:hypothetical protein